jgi:disulfide bond formation protein DsbB
MLAVWCDAGMRRFVLMRIAPPMLLLAGCGWSDSRSDEIADDSANAAVTAATVRSPSQDPQRGRLLYMASCSSCHGQRGQGMPHSGANLRISAFVARQSDQQLVAFLKRGRAPGDPESVQGLIMPPRGGNPALDDAALETIVAFLRQLQQEAQGDAAPVAQLPRE